MDQDNDGHANDGDVSDSSSPSSEASNTVYCDCQTVDDHTVMLQCPRCGGWFHARCYGIRQDDATQLLITFACKTCTAVDPGYKIQYKAMCQFNKAFQKTGETPECRLPVRRVIDGAEKDDPYCSEAHREAYLRYIVSKMPDTDEPSRGGIISQQELANAVEAAPTIAQFKALGKRPDMEVGPEFDYNTIFNAEEIGIMAECQLKVARLHERNKVWDERGAFLTMGRMKFRELQKQIDKNVCGYTTLYSKNEPEFVEWRAKPEAIQIFADKKITDDSTFCKIIKCKKHATWLDNETSEFEMEKALIADDLEALERKQTNMKQHARTREVTKNHRN